MSVQSTVFADTAILYGAWRWWKSVHNDPKWQFKGVHKETDDFLLFSDLAHAMVLYDQVVFDNSSWQSSELASWYVSSILELVTYVNSQRTTPLLVTKKLFAEPTYPLKVAVCRLVSEAVTRLGEAEILRMPVPWAYSHPQHNERQVFERLIIQHGLPLSLVPFVVFSFRGLCYAGFSKHYGKSHNVPVAYWAAHRRLSALQLLLDKSSVDKMYYYKSGFSDLLDEFELPSSGFDFSDVSSLLPTEVSSLADELALMPPREAIDFILAFRETHAAREVRARWATRLSDARNGFSLAGRSCVQAVTNSVVNGDLYLVCGVPTESAA